MSLPSQSTKELEPEPDTTQFSLLDFPPEIRNIIYALILIPPITHHVTRPGAPFLRVCRQIREEASSIYYGGNIFQLQFDLGVPLASEGHMLPPLPLPLPSNMFLDTFGPDSVLNGIENLSVSWVHCNIPRREVLMQLSLGFIGIGDENMSRQKRPRWRIGGDGLDWTNHNDVVQAYLAALKQTWSIIRVDVDGVHIAWDRPSPNKSLAHRLFTMAAIEDLVRAMRLFKERCPKAMSWVEPTIDFYKRGWSPTTRRMWGF